MLKNVTIALVLLVGGSVMTAENAFAGGGMRRPPQRIGKIDKSSRMKHFPRRQKKDFGGIKATAPHQLPG